MTTKVAKFGFAAAILVAAFAFAMTAAAVSATEIYTPSTGYLSVGSGMGAKAYQNSNVVAAQIALNACVPGTALVLDGKFGPLTKGKFMAFQASKNIQVDGIIGPVTAAQLAACSTSQPTPPGGSNDNGGSNNGGSLSGGEASLEQYSIDSEDDAEEGAEKHVATIEFDVEDADAEINRVDVSFNSSSVGGTADEDPWDVFSTITLKVDGDEIASEDISDEDDWLDNDGAVTEFRLSTDYVAEEGETVEIEVYLEAQNNVDDLANADWIIFVEDEGIRFVDGEGFTGTIGDTSETVAFSIDAEGGNESIEIKSSSSDPEASNLEVADDDESEWHEIMIFKLEAEENDIELDTLELTVTTGTANYEDVIDDIKIDVDGTEVDDVTVVAPATTTADLTFDIDGDVTVDADDTIEVSVWAMFKKADGVNYTAPETVQVTVTAVDGEGADDVSDTATLDSEEHTLSLAVAELSTGSFSIDKAEDDASGTISIEFTLDASDAEEDVTFDVASNAGVDGSTDDVAFTLSGTDTTIAVAALTLLDGDASYAGGTWTVTEGGEEATFVLDVTFTTVDAGDNGTYRVTLDSVAGISVDKTSSGMTLSN